MWRKYEQAKQDWLARNPKHTSKQYTEAMKEIAKRLGL